MRFLTLFTIFLIFNSTFGLKLNNKNRKLSQNEIEEIKKRADDLRKQLNHPEMLLFFINPYKVLKLFWKMKDLPGFTENIEGHEVPLKLTLQTLLLGYFINNDGFIKSQIKYFKLNQQEGEAINFLFGSIYKFLFLTAKSSIEGIKILKEYGLLPLYKFIKYWVSKIFGIDFKINDKSKKKINDFFDSLDFASLGH